MSLITQLALATDDEIDHALKVMTKGLFAKEAAIEEFMGHEEAFRAELASVLPMAVKLETVATGKEMVLFRGVALEIASNPELAPKLEAALKQRKTLIEPVTTALVLAGIILVLQTDIEFEHTRKAGKKSTRIVLKKTPTSENILQKLFGLFK